jgi:hypothetical protein
MKKEVWGLPQSEGLEINTMHTQHGDWEGHATSICLYVFAVQVYCCRCLHGTAWRYGLGQDSTQHGSSNSSSNNSSGMVAAGRERRRLLCSTTTSSSSSSGASLHQDQQQQQQRLWVTLRMCHHLTQV